MNRSFWTVCWKCEEKIKTKEDCNYLKCRDGHYDFCPSCYEEFLSKTTEFIRPERSKRDELKRSLNHAMYDFHEKMYKQGEPLIASWTTKAPSLFVHKEEDFSDCEVCKEILSTRKESNERKEDL